MQLEIEKELEKDISDFSGDSLHEYLRQDASAIYLDHSSNSVEEVEKLRTLLVKKVIGFGHLLIWNSLFPLTERAPSYPLAALGPLVNLFSSGIDQHCQYHRCYPLRGVSDL
jgi:hypothetical protein